MSDIVIQKVGLCSSEAASNGFDIFPSEGQIVCHIPELPLAPGNYVFTLLSTVGGAIADWISGAGTLHVVWPGTTSAQANQGLVKTGSWSNTRGLFLPQAEASRID